MAQVSEERWDDWAARQLADPASGVRQLMSQGLSRDTAFLVIMLGKVHGQLLDLERALSDPPENWRGESG